MRVFMALSLLLLLVGCQAAGPLKSGPLSQVPLLGAGSQQASLRRAVENDPFPTAAQSGLASSAKREAAR